MPTDSDSLEEIGKRVVRCRICRDRFAATATAHEPRPVFWCTPTAKLLVAGQAPGARVHASGRFFDDPSGDRLRHWMGIDKETFYDRSRIAILPMAFCFPGYDQRGSDLQPPSICARTWRRMILERLPSIQTSLLIGRHAQSWHLGNRSRGGVRRLVSNWREFAPAFFPLPHPSWRNNALISDLNGFENELLPAMRNRIQELLAGQSPSGQ